MHCLRFACGILIAMSIMLLNEFVYSARFYETDGGGRWCRRLVLNILQQSKKNKNGDEQSDSQTGQYLTGRSVWTDDKIEY